MRASSTTYVLVAYWGIFSGLAYVVYYYCLGKIEAAKASSFIYLSPLFATILSIVLLGEQMTISFLAGLALTLGGIWITQKGRNTNGIALQNDSTSNTLNSVYRQIPL
jgi:drug/metabolite transporter (DMT)-like permease